jgi:hypothetical protein
MDSPDNGDNSRTADNHSPVNRDNPLLTWVAAFLIALVFFYALDHIIMSMQGLPLKLNLTPAQ